MQSFANCARFFCTPWRCYSHQTTSNNSMSPIPREELPINAAEMIASFNATRLKDLDINMLKEMPQKNLDPKEAPSNKKKVKFNETEETTMTDSQKTRFSFRSSLTIEPPLDGKRIKKEIFIIPAKEELLRESETSLWYTHDEIEEFKTNRDLEINNYLKEHNLPTSSEGLPKFVIKNVSRKLYQPNPQNNPTKEASF